MLEIRRAGPEDARAVKVLLSICLMPPALPGAGKTATFVAQTERGIIGAGTLEQVGDACGILCSLAVMPGYRKQQIGRRLVQRLIAYAEENQLDQLFLLTQSACDYFLHIGFEPVDQGTAPRSVSESTVFREFGSSEARLMLHRLSCVAANDSVASEHECPQRRLSAVAERARGHFDSGYFCAESVLLAVAEQAGVRSSLLPAIATGFCNGLAKTWGTCGALSGAIMGVNLVYGRRRPGDPVTDNYAAVRHLIDQFTRTCGASQCSELLGCDLDTSEGKRIYRDNRLQSQCREYVGTAARIAAVLVHERESPPQADAA